MIVAVDRQRDAIRGLCRHFGVRRLDLFGSAARGEFYPETSDIDVVAIFADTQMPGLADRYLGFAEAQEALFGRPVDVVTEHSIKNPYFRQAVESTRQPLYDERDTPATA